MMFKSSTKEVTMCPFIPLRCDENVMICVEFSNPICSIEKLTVVHTRDAETVQTVQGFVQPTHHASSVISFRHVDIDELIMRRSEKLFHKDAIDGASVISTQDSFLSPRRKFSSLAVYSFSLFFVNYCTDCRSENSQVIQLR